jgi:uncharacterized membrane protein YkoI
MFRELTAAILLLSLSVLSLRAADQACLSRAEQQVAVTGGQAVPLAAAIKTIHGHSRGRQVVRAQLCREPKGLVYVLTVLARDGKVTHARVEAANGSLINEL